MTGVVCALVGNSVLTAVAEVIRSKKGIRAVGNAQIDTAQSKFGGASALFDGSGDYLQIAENSDFQFTSTSSWTIECWARFASLKVCGLIMKVGTSSPFAGFSLGLNYNTSGKLAFYPGTGGYVDFTDSVTTNTWYHIAVVSNAGNIRFYLNGTQQSANITATSGINNSTQPLVIGAYVSGAVDHLNGWMDEIRISNSARYTASFTAPSAPFVNDANTLLLIHANGTDASTYFEDDNGTGRSQVGIIRSSDGEIDTAQSKFGGSSCKFNNIGNGYLTIDKSAFDLGSGNFTVECWAYFNAENTRVSGFSRNTLINKRDPSNVRAGAWGLYWDAANSNKLIWEEIISGGGSVQSSNNAISTGSWLHIAAVRNGTTITLYVNGTSVGSGTLSTNYTITNYNCYIGWWGTSFYSLNGWVDEIRISNSARYTSNFTAPTAPFVNDANTLLLIHADSTDGSTVFTDDNGTARSQVGIQALGNAAISSTQSKFGGSSISTDGTDDRLLLPDNSNLVMSGAFTYEFWMYCNNVASPANQHLYAQLSVDTTIQFSGTGGSLIVYDGGTRTISTLASTTWYHFAIVRSGSTVQCYINGTAAGSSWTNSSTTRFSWSTATIANRPNNLSAGFNGYIDEIRLSNIARYTSNFTAPTVPFVNDENTVFLIHGDGTNGSTVIRDDNGVTPTHQYS